MVSSNQDRMRTNPKRANRRSNQRTQTSAVKNGDKFDFKNGRAMKDIGAAHKAPFNDDQQHNEEYKGLNSKRIITLKSDKSLLNFDY